MKRKILLSPDPVQGGDPAPTGSTPQPNPLPPQTAPPPAAAVVLAGTKTERELQLEEDNRKLAEESERLAKEKKDREVRISELEDENHQLKSIPRSDPAAEPDDDKPLRIGFKA